MQQVEKGRALAMAGRLEEAVQLLTDVARAAPAAGEPRVLLGLVESQLGRHEAALSTLAAAEKALERQLSEAGDGSPVRGRLAPQLGTARFEQGNVYARIGRAEEAHAMYRAVLRAEPKHAEAISNIGVLLYGASRYAEAAASFAHATRLLPAFADAYQHLGASHKALGAPDEAYAAYGAAAKLSGARSTEPLRGMALVERERGRIPQALQLLARAARLHPHSAQLHLDEGIVHDYAEARLAAYEAYGRALRLQPEGLPQAVYFRGRAAKSLCLWRGWDEQMRSVKAALTQPGGATAMGVDPVASLSYPFTPEELLVVVHEALQQKLALTAAAHVAVASTPWRHAKAALALRAAAAGPAAHGGGGGGGAAPLRVGFVSSYFRDHNLLRLCRGLFLGANPAHFAFHLFAESDDDGSEILRQVQAAPAVRAGSFVRIRGVPTAEAVASLRDAALHVAINLNGHHWNAASEVVRFPLFLHGAAPVQGSYMGYPGPNGARFLHYAYLDAIVAPVRRAAASFTERLALLPHTYYLSDYAAAHPEQLQPPPPSADGLPTDAVLLCSLNQLPKLDPHLFTTWLNGLRRAAAAPPATKLWILKFPAAAAERLRAEAAAHLSAAPRSSLLDLPTVEYADHLRRAYHCDLFVDSRLCNAHTSATDALWAGTPLLTLPGGPQTARVAASLLNAVQLPSLVVHTLRAYEEQLVRLTEVPGAARLWRA